MGLKRKFRVLLAGSMFGASYLLTMPARADEEQLQRQIDAMKHQLEAMQRELAHSKKKRPNGQPAAHRRRSSRRATATKS